MLDIIVLKLLSYVLPNFLNIYCKKHLLHSDCAAKANFTVTNTFSEFKYSSSLICSIACFYIHQIFGLVKKTATDIFHTVDHFVAKA